MKKNKKIAAIVSSMLCINTPLIQANSKANDKKLIAKISVPIACVGLAAYKLGKEGIYNGLFYGSNKSWYKSSYTTDEITQITTDSMKKNNLKSISLNSPLGYLQGFERVPKNHNKRVILVFGGNSEIAAKSLDFAINRSPGEDKEKSIFISFDYPSYGKSTGGKLSEEKMRKFAYYVLTYATNNYKDCEIIVYGYSLGGYPASSLGINNNVKEINLWSPVCWDSAVEGLSGSKWLGVIGRYWAFGGSKFDSISNIKNSHKSCKINLFSGSLAKKDFLSIELTVLKNKNMNRTDVARECWEKLTEEEPSLKKRLTVSLAPVGHCDKDFDSKVWNGQYIWNYKKNYQF